MLIKFATNELNSFDNGARVFRNEGEPFEVDDVTGADLLRRKAKIVTGKTAPTAAHPKGKVTFDEVSIFEAVKSTKHSLLPEGYPHRADLEKNKVLTFEDLFALTEESEPKLKNIGDQKLKAILEARNAYNADGTLKPVETDAVLTENANIPEVK